MDNLIDGDFVDHTSTTVAIFANDAGGSFPRRTATATAPHVGDEAIPRGSAMTDMNELVTDHLAFGKLNISAPHMSSSPAAAQVKPSPSLSPATHHETMTNAPARVRKPIIMPADPLVVQWAEGKAGGRSKNLRARVKFIISHDDELVAGVIKAIHKEMSRKRKDVAIEIREIPGKPPVQYLHIVAPSDGVAMECVNTAQTMADEIISDKTFKTSGVFLEPPRIPKNAIRIVLENEAAGARPRLLPSHQVSDPIDPEQRDAYLDGFCLQLSMALKRVGRINSGHNIKVHFGHFFLQSTRFRPTPEGYDFARFSNMLGGSRAMGRGLIKSQIGDMDEALQVLRTIKREGSIFRSIKFTIPSVANVQPDYVFEGHSTQYRFEASLLPSTERWVIGADRPYKLSNVKVFKAFDRDWGSGELEMIILSLDKRFDWKIGTVNELPETEISSQQAEDYLTTATVKLPEGRKDEMLVVDQAYPRVSLVNSRLSEQFEKVAVKSIFKFAFADTSYILEFTIQRQWDTIQAMSCGHVEPMVTYGITLYGEHWGEGLRAADIGNYGRGWGDELQLLLRDEAGIDGLARVRAFVAMVHATRDALDGA